jgi:hypothetical protein
MTEDERMIWNAAYAAAWVAKFNEYAARLGVLGALEIRNERTDYARELAGLSVEALRVWEKENDK